MKSSTTTTKVASNVTRRRKSSKRTLALSSCPTGGAGWCSYPFSPAQLEKRLRAKIQATSQSQLPDPQQQKTK